MGTEKEKNTKETTYQPWWMKMREGGGRDKVPKIREGGEASKKGCQRRSRANKITKAKESGHDTWRRVIEEVMKKPMTMGKLEGQLSQIVEAGSCHLGRICRRILGVAGKREGDCGNGPMAKKLLPLPLKLLSAGDIRQMYKEKN